MLRKVGVFLLFAASAICCVAQTQTPRQALIEMFSGRDSKAFEKHLPKIMQQRMAAFSAGSGGHMGLPTSPQSLPMGMGRKGDVRWFETGPLLMLAQDSNGRCEVKVEKDDLQGDRDDLELSFNVAGNGDLPNLGDGTRVLLTLQKEDGIWRLSEFGLNFKMKLDGSFLEAIAKRMSAGSVMVSSSEPRENQPVAAKKMSAQELSASEATALASVQKILEAQNLYRKTNPAAGFTCNADALGVAETNGYRTMLVGCKGTPVGTFKVTLTPVGMSIKGQRAFCADETGVIRFADDGRGLSCLSEHNQITSGPDTAEGR
jgi:hypothetical protein